MGNAGKARLCLGVAAAALIVGTNTGWAQTKSAADTTELPEVTVTALRSKVSTQDAPAAIAAFSEATIEDAHITRPQDFISLTPNVSLVESNHAGEAFLVIRGEAPARNAESSSAVVIDGVQQASANEFNSELLDIQQIEILKGPQGALYGRNAVGGAVVITTKAPTNTWEGWILGGLGNGISEKAQGSISGPIIENKVLFRLTGSFRNTDGYRENVNTGEKPDRFQNGTGRLRVDVFPTETTTVHVTLGGSQVDGGGIAFNSQLDTTVLPKYTDPHDFPLNTGPININNVNSLAFVANIRSFNAQAKQNASIKIDQELGWGSLSSVSAYSYIRDVYGADQFPYAYGAYPVFGAPETQWVYLDTQALTQDFRFTSPTSDPLRFLVGGYVAHFDSDRKTNIRLDQDGILHEGDNPVFTGSGIDPSVSYRYDHQTNDIYAIYGNADYDITKQLQLSFALRYDHEERDVSDRAPAPYSLFPGQFLSATYQAIQPKATLRYIPYEGLTLYTTYGQGFKSGGFNPFNSRKLAVASDPNTIIQDQYGKESTTTYEVGFHTQLLENRLAISGAGFITDSTNAQVFEFFPIPSLQANANVDESETKGIEISAKYKLAQGLTTEFSYGYTDSVITALKATPADVGNRMPYVPLYQITAGIQYNYPITEDYSVTTRADFQRLGNTWFDVNNTPATNRDPLNLVNLAVTVDTGGSLSFQGWTKNLFNKQYAAESVVLLPIAEAVYRAPGRTWGVEMTYRF